MGWVDAQAGVPSAGWPRAQLAFKDSMVRGILQFTPSIAFRYVLHRCESRDIRCRESCCSLPWRARRSASAAAERSFKILLGAAAPGLCPAEGAARPPRVQRLTGPRSVRWHTTMILPQVHLRKPCYDFSFL